MLRSPQPPSRRYTGKIADPERWNSLKPRPGDIVVSTPPKSGTTWTQGILALLLSGDPNVDAAISRNAPWIDIETPEQDEIIAALNAQTGRRQIKTHTPLDGIPLCPDLSYISVFRHPIDVHLSFRRHVENMKQDVLGDIYPPDIHEGFRIFLEGDHRDGASLESIADHFRSALELAGQTNFLCLHYADMIRDLNAAVHQIAEHVSILHPPALMDELIAAAKFENMKKNAERFAVSAGEGFWQKDSDFFDSGTSQKWLGVLTGTDLAAYNARITDLLSEEERHWLEHGGGSLRNAFQYLR
ncbi:sulfotransferase domain-containing protein [Cribrihabitans pelagius]|uniref:sulfotransferase domain-containing protein n=1 Tax=Cribrihabitans pelagius TaxID=1765746 RepID=UPI003B58BCFB